MNIIYTSTFCSYCVRAKQLLKEKGISFEEINLDHDPKKREELEQLTQQRTTPQIFLNDKFVGGFEQLKALYVSGELDKLIGEE